MDKATFLTLAPTYYEVAVIKAVRESSRGVLDDRTLRLEYSGPRPGQASYLYLQHRPLLQHAITMLAQRGAIEAIEDPFGPTQYKLGPKAGGYISAAEKDPSSPFAKCSASTDADAWLREALTQVNETYRQLKIEEADFAVQVDEWEPLTLDRNSEQLRTAIESLDSTIKEVEQSNGYAASSPEERAFVLDNLRMVSEKLKKAATVSLVFIRTHGLHVLQKIADKFSGAAMGEAAKSTLSAFGRWLHEVLPHLF